MSERIAHIIRPANPCKPPDRLICFSIDPRVETLGSGVQVHTFRCAAASVSYLDRGRVAHREYEDFYGHERLLEWIGDRSTRCGLTWCAGYRMGYQLTLAHFWDGLNRGSYSWLWGVLEDPPTICEVSYGRRRVRFVDLTNFWRVPLTELLGVAGLSELGSPEPNPPFQDALGRCRSRVRVIEECICQANEMMMTTWGTGLRSTAASTAYSLWRNLYMNVPLYVHARTDALSLERSGLFGGVLQTWKTGLVNCSVHSLDVNSLYPSIMASQELPVRMIDFRNSVALTDMPRLLTHCWCLARVVAAPSRLLPIRQRAREVTYSDKPGEYVVCGRELVSLVEAGLVSRVCQLARYAAGPLLALYATDLYARRLAARAAGDVSGELLLKMLLNSISGKFGQKHRVWKDLPHTLAAGRWGYWYMADVATRRVVRCRSVAGQAQRLIEEDETASSCPSVTAAITSEGRSRLWDLVDTAWPDNVYYCDTDCLHVNDNGRRWLEAAGELHPTALGKLKVVAQGEDAYYWCPKWYRVGEKWVSNVIHPDALEVAEGLWIQEAKCGLPSVFMGIDLSQVTVKLRELSVRTGPGAYRPRPKSEECQHGKT